MITADGKYHIESFGNGWVYMDEMIEDCYELPKDLPSWMIITYDYDILRMDYTHIDFNGETYLTR